MTRGRARGGGSAAGSGQPTIKQALEGFVASRPARWRRAVRSALQLLEACLNNYAYQSLGAADARRFDRLYDAEGAAHREYCEIFGPERIVPELRQFFGWFLIRKVMARAEDLEIVARETGRFVEWLGEQGHLPRKAAAEGAALAAEAVGVVPRAEEAAHLWHRHLERHGPGAVGNEIEGHFGITRIEHGRVWLESYDEEGVLGPIAAPADVVKRLAVGWEVSGVVGRVGRKWVVSEVWNVYPGVG